MTVLQGGAQGAIQGWGLCYSGAQPIWNCEYTGNTMVRSNGIALVDNSLKGTKAFEPPLSHIPTFGAILSHFLFT